MLNTEWLIIIGRQAGAKGTLTHVPPVKIYIPHRFYHRVNYENNNDQWSIHNYVIPKSIYVYNVISEDAGTTIVQISPGGPELYIWIKMIHTFNYKPISVTNVYTEL